MDDLLEPARLVLAAAIAEGVWDEAIYALDTNGVVLACNEGSVAITGRARAHVRGKHVSLLYTDEEVELGLAHRELREAGLGKRVIREAWQERADGTRFWGYRATAALHNESGTHIGFSRLVRDLTERVRVEEAIRVSEAKFAGIVSLATDAIVSVDESLRIVLFNHGAEQSFGYSAAEVLGQPLDILLPERFRGSHGRHVRGFADSPIDARRMGERGEIVALRKGGDEFPAEASISKISVGGSHFYTAVLHDISARKDAEVEISALLRSEQDARRHAELAERRARLLARASELLADFLDVETTLASIARLAVSAMADFCVVQLLDAAGQLRPAAVVHADPARTASLETLFRDYAPPAGAASPAGFALRIGEAQLVEDVGGSGVEALLFDLERMPLDRALAPRSYICAPVLARGQTLGLLTLALTRVGSRFSRDDLRMAEELATHVALALYNAQLYREAERARRAAEAAAARIQRIQTITVALSRARTVAEVAAAVVQHATAGLPGTAGTVALLGEGGAWLELVSPIGDPAEVAADGRIPIDADLPLAVAAREGALVLVNSPDELVARFPAVAATILMTGTHTYAAVPLLVERRVTGAIGFGFPEGHQFEAGDREFLLAVGGQCAQALERVRLFESERGARTRAEAAVGARDELLRIVAHDIGNPLGGILITTSALLRTLPPGDSVATEAVRDIRDAAEQIQRLRRDLLDVATIDAGHLSVVRTRQKPWRLCDEARAQVAPLAIDKGIELRVEAAAELPDVLADRTRILQVLGNLLGNGIKFTATGGSVEVRGSAAEGEVHFTVRDTGPGIAEEHQPYVFDRFYKAREGNRPGAGLGLAIARGIVEAHGGRIWLERREGVGCAFTFTLPVAE